MPPIQPERTLGSLALTASCLRFTAEVVTPIALREQKGAAIRGAIFQAMRRFCPRHDEGYPDCADCLLRPACPVAELISTTRPGERRGRDGPGPAAGPWGTCPRENVFAGASCQAFLPLIRGPRPPPPSVKQEWEGGGILAHEAGRRR